MNNFFKVPNAVFISGLTKYELLVYFYLCRLQNNKGFSFPSYATIARNCAISRRKTVTVVKALIKKRLLKKQVRPIGYRKNKSNLFVLIHEHLGSAQYALGSARRAPYKELVINNYSYNGVSPALKTQADPCFPFKEGTLVPFQENRDGLQTSEVYRC